MTCVRCSRVVTMHSLHCPLIALSLLSRSMHPLPPDAPPLSVMLLFHCVLAMPTPAATLSDTLCAHRWQGHTHIVAAVADSESSKRTAIKSPIAATEKDAATMTLSMYMCAALPHAHFKGVCPTHDAATS